MKFRHEINDLILWIAWEKHRRSIELSKHFNIPSIFLTTNLPRPIKYPILIIKTIIAIFLHRPAITILQCPSIFLVLTGWIMKKLINFILIIDAHNACLNPDKDILNIFRHLAYHIIAVSDFIIVTNNCLAELVNIPKEKTIILKDKIFTKPSTNRKILGGDFNLCYISSDSCDEPLNEALKAFTLLPKNYFVYITGKHKRKTIDNYKTYKNIIFTGFIQTSHYCSLINSCDIIITLTRRYNCLQCGATEAVSFAIPLICSNNNIEKCYFGDKGIIYTQNQSKKIYSAVMFAREHIDDLRTGIKETKRELTDIWYKNAAIFHTILQNIYSNNTNKTET